jgi:hypothetical protein
MNEGHFVEEGRQVDVLKAPTSTATMLMYCLTTRPS